MVEPGKKRAAARGKGVGEFTLSALRTQELLLGHGQQRPLGACARIRQCLVAAGLCQRELDPLPGRQVDLAGRRLRLGLFRAVGLGSLSLRQMEFFPEHRLVLGAACARRRLLGPGLCGLGQDRQLCGMGAARPRRNLLRPRLLRPAQRQHHQGQYQPHPGHECLQERHDQQRADHCRPAIVS